MKTPTTIHLKIDKKSLNVHKYIYLPFTGEKGFEPLTFGFGDHYSTIETIPLLYYHNLLITLKNHIFYKQKPAIGLEPITFGLQNRYSTN